jgi:uncharacterized membrane protein HdeD (DUF308 family)
MREGQLVQDPETVQLTAVRITALDAARAWWLMLIVGLASLIAGIILVLKPSNSLATLAVVVGIFFLIDGIVELVRSFGSAVESRGLAAIIGVLGVIVGIILIRHPTKAVAAIGLLIGLWLVAAGVIRLVGAFVEGSHPLIRAAIAAVEIVLGIVIVSDPHIGYTALAVIVGISLILNGLCYSVLAFAMRRAKSELEHPAAPT